MVVLGAGGFIGSRVVRAALAAGAAVTAVCPLQSWRLGGVDEPGLELVELEHPWWSLDAAPALATVLDGARALCLLAYEAPGPGLDPEQHERRVNLAGAVRIAKLAFARGVHVVFAGSADVYGAWHAQPVSEETEPAPVSPYAVVKLETEQVLVEAAAQPPPGLLAVLRISTVYGTGELGPRAIPSFVRALIAGNPPVVHGDGSDVRDYVHVVDVAAAFCNAAARSTEGVLNVGSGEGRPTRQVLDDVAAALGVVARPRLEPAARPPSRLVLDVSRARSRIGLAPSRSFDEALVAEVEWLAATFGS